MSFDFCFALLLGEGSNAAIERDPYLVLHRSDAPITTNVTTRPSPSSFFPERTQFTMRATDGNKETRVIWTFHVADEGEVTVKANRLDGRAIMKIILGLHR
jgi:hypothetical protein